MALASATSPIDIHIGRQAVSTTMHAALHTLPLSFNPALLASLPALSAPEVAAPGWAELAPHRSRLVQFARRRLLDPSLAEDLVHDVFEAV